MNDHHPLFDQEQRLNEENQLGNGQKIDQPPPGAARDKEERHNNQKDLGFWQEHLERLWEAVSFRFFQYALASQLPSFSSENALFWTLWFFLNLLIGVAYAKFGTPRLFLSTRVESNVGVLLWFFSFFVCFATDAEWIQFLNAWWCPDNPLPFLLFEVLPGGIQLQFFLWTIVHDGKVSLLLILMQRIYWYCKRRGDTKTFVAQFLILLAIDMRCVYCTYRDKMFNDGTKPFKEDHESAPVIKYTIETLEVIILFLITGVKWFLTTGIKWAFIVGLVLWFAEIACLVAVDIADDYARQHQNRARRWFLGYNPRMHLN